MSFFSFDEDYDRTKETLSICFLSKHLNKERKGWNI